ncbi:MAG: DoxX family protein [Ignavibacteriaceae bacterium]|nr:DoxX family protein [Ignavibacteriaceae bacterium]
MLKKIIRTDSAKATVLIRFIVGAVFFTEGIQKFLFPDVLGVGRFIKIGIIYPAFFAPFVGVVEIIAGGLLIIGLLTRIDALLLLINISVAIITTKIPMLHNSFWTFLHEARVDFCMFFGTLFFLIKGGGYWSFDFLFHRKG